MLGHRIMIVGCPGAGKSTLARALSQRLGLPVIHLDQLYWKPGWVEQDKEAFKAAVTVALSQDGGWICDGNYSSTYDLRAALADTIIWIDFPRWRCLWRIVRRLARSWGRTRPDMAEGCPERLNLSFLVFVWRFPARNKDRLERFFKEKDGRLVCVRLRTPRDVARFLTDLS